MENGLGGIDSGGCSKKIAEAIASKFCATDGKIYEAKTAEEKDLAFIAENTCMLCGKRFKDGELRILPPQTVQKEDIYVKNGIVARRYICENCYNNMISTSQVREKIKSEYRKEFEAKNNKIIKGIVRGMLREKRAIRI